MAAEFIVIAVCEAGKNSLYIRSILEDLGIDQDQAIIIYKDNQGAIAMANSGKPIKMTQYIDTRQFVLQSWVKQDLVQLERISTKDNSSDALAKTPLIFFLTAMLTTTLVELYLNTLMSTQLPMS